MIALPWYEEWYWGTRRCAVKTAGLMLFSALTFPSWYYVTGYPFWLLIVPFFLALGNVINCRIIRPRVDATRRADPPDTCSVDCAVIHYLVCIPATAVLDGSLLTLRPVSGPTMVVNLNDVIVVREAHWFSHSLYLTKTGFTLYFSGGKSIDFAVANSVAKCWRPALQQKRQQQQAEVA